MTDPRFELGRYAAHATIGLILWNGFVFVTVSREPLALAVWIIIWEVGRSYAKGQVPRD